MAVARTLAAETPLLSGSQAVARAKDKLKKWAAKVQETQWGQKILDQYADGGYPKYEHLAQMATKMRADGEPEWFEIMELEYELVGGDMEGLAGAIQDAHLDVKGTGKIDYQELKNQSEHVDKVIEAAGTFMLNVAVVSALLVSIQLSLFLSEAKAHKLISHWCNMAVNSSGFMTKVNNGFVWAISGYKASEAPDEFNCLMVTLETLASCALLVMIVRFMLIIAQSTKAYGHLMYWSMDVEAKLWYARSRNMQKIQGECNEMIKEFFQSIIPYTFMVRGPIVCLFMIIGMYYAAKQYRIYTQTAAQYIMGKHAYRILKTDFLDRTA